MVSPEVCDPAVGGVGGVRGGGEEEYPMGNDVVEITTIQCSKHCKLLSRYDGEVQWD